MESLWAFERYPIIEELERKEDDEEINQCEPQVFEDHDIISERFRKTFYYGKLPITSDRFSFSMTEFCVDQFNDLGLEALEDKLNKLDMEKAAKITRDTCATPTSLILALLYLDRLRNKNPAYLLSVSSTDLFLVSLLVASKFLHDDGEEDEVFTDEWANSANMEKKDLNKLEIEFLVAIDWQIYVSNNDFEKMTSSLETAIATRHVNSRGWTTYSDLLVLSKNLHMEKLWALLAECTFKVSAVCASAYAASLMTMLGTCYLLSKTSLSPSNVETSIGTLYSSIKSGSSCHTVVNELPDTEVPAGGHGLDEMSQLVADSISDDHKQEITSRFSFNESARPQELKLSTNRSAWKTLSRRMTKTLTQQSHCRRDHYSHTVCPIRNDVETNLESIAFLLKQLHSDGIKSYPPHRNNILEAAKLGFL